MKIAVTSTGDSPSSPIDQRFGRAGYFLVYDLETEEWAVVSNVQESGAAHGAGIQAGQRIVDLGVGTVLTGHCGPKASSVLTAAEIGVFQILSGTAEDAIAAYKDGTLVPLTGEAVRPGQA